jgi:hypothetical protein
MAFISVAISMAASLIGQGLAGDFLGVAKVSVQDLESQFLEELATANSQAKTRLLNLESTLRPMYLVVPKETDGTLSHNVVRYVLHRYFVRQHGWFIRGLEPGSEFTNMTTQEQVGLDPSKQALQDMQEWVPSYLQQFLETLIGGRGVNLRELAVFAATLEDLVHKEEIGHLHKAYSTLWLDESEPVDHQNAFNVLQTYMMIYMLGGNFTVNTPEKASHLMRLFAQKVASWDKTIAWLQRIHQKFQPSGTSVDFNTTAKIVEELGERYGVFNDAECGRLKAELMKMESQKPGRVRLSDFYKKSLFGAWEFNEKIDYLRSAGLLDESEPSTPFVLLPNYVASRPNCLASSSFYAVCCRNECEDLMEHMEREVGGSSARPPQIAKLVAKLSTETVAAPRVLPKTLMQRLQEVASRNHGQVPLHGRLFAQWMHHAFPRECPYPQQAGSASPLTPDEWMQKTGSADAKASKEEMLSTISNDNCRFAPKGVECSGQVIHSDDDTELPWDSNEELLIVREQLEKPRFTYPRIGDGVLHPGRDVVCWFSVCSLSWMLSLFFWKLKGTISDKKVSALSGALI